MKIFQWLSEHILFVFTLFLLAFIPLYPKLPLIDIRNTWVYIRAEDFVVVITLFVWIMLLFRRKITLKTPLTLPIIVFWIIGGISTIHAMLLIFPFIANVFPNVAFLSFLRRVEYISLFFIAYAGIKDKRFLSYVIATLAITLFLVVIYGFGQKYLGFPAYLTMNEEFAKGLPIRLSPLSRVPSTFGGHYDLAAYLVLIIPILSSMVFGFRNKIIRLLLLATIPLGFILLFMTVSRVSFFVLLVSIAIVVFFQKRKLIIFSFPVIFVVLAFLFFIFAPSLLDRLGSTIKEVDLLVDAKTGIEIGNIKKVPAKYFENKIIERKVYLDKGELNSQTIRSEKELLLASPSAILPFSAVPQQVILVVLPNTPTGENLPQGTGYINLSLSPVTKRMGEFFYEKSVKSQGTELIRAYIFNGDFLIKRAFAYDLSFTTRFQGEWPRAVEAFKRNIFLGSGYSSISLAVDNNYLRILGETGLLGFASFFAIFLIAGVYIRKVLPEVDSPVVRSFVVGFIAGVVGLTLNAILIDVFEASKIAFLLWLLTGVVFGTLNLYQTKYIDLYKEVKNIATSTYAIIVYICVLTAALFLPMVNNYFVGDDFTWFRWVADCNNTVGLQSCQFNPETIFRYFTQADGFFYRPGTKTYFLLMYLVFWLNQTVYHIVSLFLHFVVAALVFLLAKKILRDSKLSVLASFLFLILSGYSEAVFWASSTGFLFNAMFILLSLLFFIAWEEKKKNIYFVVSFLSLIFSLFFHELGVVTPLFMIMYKFTTEQKVTFKSIYTKIHYVLLFLPIFPYLAVRYLAQSHWFSGDYSYNLLKLPFNTVGNAIGYFFLAIFGPLSLPFYQSLRNFSKDHIIFAIVFISVTIYFSVLGYRFLIKKVEYEEKKIIVFGLLFFGIALLPFLGLGNITSRYSYLASFGFILLFVFSIKKLHIFLRSNGQNIALAAATAVITLFSLLHIMQLQQTHSNWYEAGEKAKRFFLAVDGLYEDYWIKEPMKFYFVDVPIREGEAWVFPVGLNDALWLSFRSPNIRVYQSQSVEQALSLVDGSKNEKVFVFDKSGKIIERKKNLKAQ